MSGGISCVLCQRNIIDDPDVLQVVTNGSFLVNDEFYRHYSLLGSMSLLTMQIFLKLVIFKK